MIDRSTALDRWMCYFFIALSSESRGRRSAIEGEEQTDTSPEMTNYAQNRQNRMDTDRRGRIGENESTTGELTTE